MKRIIAPAELKGAVAAPPSKSAAHRALILAYLSGEAEVAPIARSADTEATLRSLKALGAEIKVAGDTVKLKSGRIVRSARFDVGESGSTMRFMMPLAAALGVEAEFVGAGKLGERPYRAFAEELTRHGARFDRTAGLPLRLTGRLKAGEYVLPGNVSSQYVSGLLMTLPRLTGDSAIRLTGALESKGYVDLTIAMLYEAGVRIEETETGYRIAGSQTFAARKIAVEGDYSNAAFLLALGALTGDVTVKGLDLESRQGDRAIVDILRNMGARITVNGDRICAKKSKLKATAIDVSNIPDLAPVLSVILAAAEGEGRLTGAARLRIKECDRFRAILENLNRAGVAAYGDGDDIVIPEGALRSGEFEGYGDHRMVMSAAVLCALKGGTVTDAEAVSKSYPDFFERFTALGGRLETTGVAK